MGYGTFSLALASSLVAFGMFRVFGDGGQSRKAPPRKQWPVRSPQRADAVAPAAGEAEPQFAFNGRHLLASYSGCDMTAIRDTQGACRGVPACGGEAHISATLLESTEHIFPPDGITAVALLSESHASIHTYPEHQSCFVDIFTCGTCKVEAFDAVLHGAFSGHGSSSRRIINRHEEMVDQSVGLGETQRNCSLWPVS